MNLRRWLPACLLVPVLLGAQTVASSDVEALVRAGNAAFDRGAFAEAVLLYEKAGDRSTEPGLVAFNLATSKYHLARGGDSRAADRCRGRLLSLLSGERRPAARRALFGLGNCMLLRARGASLDSLALRLGH